MGVAILIRHGHSTANAAGVLTGRLPGVLLTETGEQQALELAAAFNGIEPTSVSVSPLERTQQTARLIFGDRPYIPEIAIIECDYGKWSGRDLKELAEDPLWQSVQHEPSNVRFPEGESLQEMGSRSIGAVRARAASDGIHVFISHGDIIKAVISDASGAHFDEFQRIVVDPCSISIVNYGSHVRLLAVNVPISGAAAALAGLTSTERGTVGGGGGVE